MKKMLLIGLCFITSGLMAQQFVETTPQPRNVILEEFTGIHCQYCPDGHRIATEMVEANPSDVFLINIHSGVFATPSAGEPDYRTTSGTAIDAAAGITGYPSASVSRSTSPWGQSRTKWVSLTNGILAQTSPVNVGVKAFVDIATRTLTTEVEIYYTADGPAPTNYLTIALTEDGILGPQSDGGNFNPTNWVDGKYKHNHVLRQLITAGDFGEKLDTTTQGYYYYKKYTTVIPENYKGIPAVLSKMHVIAFVSQAKNKILSGYGVPVDFDPALKTELSITDKTALSGMCASSVTPSVEVVNNQAQSVSAFNLTAIVNGVAYKKTINHTLAQGEKTTVTWAEIPFMESGNYAVSIVLDSIADGSGNQLIDVDEDNNTVRLKGFAFKDESVPNNKVWCGFENAKNIAYDASENARFSILGGGHWSDSSLLFFIHKSWGVEGKPAKVLLGRVDLSKTPTPGLGYWYAYSDGGMGGTAPAIAVEVSKDCGTSWTEVSNITAEETGHPADSTKLYLPASQEFRLVRADLSSFKNDKVLVKISVTPGSNGNAFFLDEISINSYTKLAVKETAQKVDADIYPNPASGNVTLRLADVSNASYTISDISGKRLKTSSIHSTKTDINTEDLKNGVYFIEITNDEVKSTQKLVISHQ